MAGTLGVATLSYAPFCFFNLINPLVAALYGWTNISISRLPGRRPGRGRHPGHDVIRGGMDATVARRAGEKGSVKTDGAPVRY